MNKTNPLWGCNSIKLAVASPFIYFFIIVYTITLILVAISCTSITIAEYICLRKWNMKANVFETIQVYSKIFDKIL